jgi:hypothetical protein
LGTSWLTTHEQITCMFAEVGLKLPRLVYWNLRPSTVSSPIESSDTPGVVLLSGFSSSLLKCFLSNDLDSFTPGSQLEAILSHDVYQALSVVDTDK